MPAPKLVPEVRKGLENLAKRLRAGKYEHCAYDAKPSDPVKRGFSMGTWHCGSVGCIGGWLEYDLSEKGILDEDRVQKSLNTVNSTDLFVPAGWSTCSGDYTPKRCAKAIENYLEHGNPRWLTVMHGTRAHMYLKRERASS